MKLSKLQANLILLTTAILWGASYLFIKQAVNAGMPAGLINALRGLIYAGLVYLFFHQTINKMTWTDFRIGFMAGFINFIGYQLQTIALKYTTPGKNAFLTATYVVMVPFVVWVMFHKRPEIKSYLAITLCVIGMMWLTDIFKSGLNFQFGDILTLIGAFVFALQIVYFGYTATDASPWIVAFMLGVVQGVGGFIYSILFERGHYTNINWTRAIWPVIILAVFASFGAQTMQIVGQKFTDATAAGLIMMTESMFGSLFSVSLGFEPFTTNLLIGGILIIISILIMQLDFSKKSRIS
ncbi:DMT family transporter [Paucilactobacillus sp. N302-9]